MCKGLKNPTPPPITDDLSRWMNESQWSSLDILTTLPSFTNLAKDMEKSSDDWYNWCMNEAAERVHMPGDWSKNLSDFKKLLVIRWAEGICVGGAVLPRDVSGDEGEVIPGGETGFGLRGTGA